MTAVSYCPESGTFTCLATRRKLAASTPDGYLRVYLLGKAVMAHRLAWLITNGEWPTGVIDHINRVRTDNRISNLRDVTRAENSRNQSPHRRRPGTSYSAAVKKKAAAYVRNLVSVSELPLYGK